MKEAKCDLVFTDALATLTEAHHANLGTLLFSVAYLVAENLKEEQIAEAARRFEQMIRSAKQVQREAGIPTL